MRRTFGGEKIFFNIYKTNLSQCVFNVVLAPKYIQQAKLFGYPP